LGVSPLATFSDSTDWRAESHDMRPEISEKSGMPFKSMKRSGDEKETLGAASARMLNPRLIRERNTEKILPSAFTGN